MHTSRNLSPVDRALYLILSQAMRRESHEYQEDRQEFEGVSEVEYNATGTHTVTLSAHPGTNDAVGAASLYTRLNVIRSIQAGIHFTMLCGDGKGAWRKGSDISIVTIDGQEYLKTGNDTEAADKLEFMPELDH